MGADGLASRSMEACHERGLLTVFGKVEVTRLAYRRVGHANLHPADSDPNLPVELHPDGLRRVAILEGRGYIAPSEDTSHSHQQITARARRFFRRQCQ